MNTLDQTKTVIPQMLADNLLKGAKELAEFVKPLSDSQWKTPVLGDGRSIGVVVHHVASCYPAEIELAQIIASKKPVVDVTKSVIDDLNAKHATENTHASKAETLALLQANSEDAARAILDFTQSELETFQPVSLYGGAPVSAQFFIEDHAMRHSYHHLAKIKESLI